MMIVPVNMAVERSTWGRKEDAGILLGRILNAKVEQGRCFVKKLSLPKGWLEEEEEEEEEEENAFLLHCRICSACPKNLKPLRTTRCCTEIKPELSIHTDKIKLAKGRIFYQRNKILAFKIFKVPKRV